jgi:P4 family phage/plasmid primase-like protien
MKTITWGDLTEAQRNEVIERERKGMGNWTGEDFKADEDLNYCMPLYRRNEYFPERTTADEKVLLSLRRPDLGMNGRRAEEVIMSRTSSKSGDNARLFLEYIRSEYVMHVPELGILIYDGKSWGSENCDFLLFNAISAWLHERAVAMVRVSEKWTTILNSAVEDKKLRAEILARMGIVRFSTASVGNSLANINGVKECATSSVTRSHRDLVAPAHLLNCENGAVDLRTGEIVGHQPEHYFFGRAVAYDPNIDFYPIHQKYVELLGGEEEALAIQEFIGYGFTGETREQKAVLAKGKPRAGKSTTTIMCERSLGGLYQEAKETLITEKGISSDSQGFAVSSLEGKRMVGVAEIGERAYIHIETLKEFTGGTKIVACKKFRDNFSMHVGFKMFLTCNGDVNISASDDAVWGRLLVFEFNKSFLGCEDPNFLPLWTSEPYLQMFLAWGIAGAKRWYARATVGEHLPETTRMKEWKASMRGRQDSLAEWLEATLIRGNQDSFVVGSDLYARYVDEYHGNKANMIGQKNFRHMVAKSLGGTNADALMGQKVIEGVRKQCIIGYRVRTVQDRLASTTPAHQSSN